MQATEFFMFAGLIGVASLIFAIMSRYYIYVDELPVAEKERKGEIEVAQDHSL